MRDHAGGFTENFRNACIDSITDDYATVVTEYCVDSRIQQTYPQISFSFDLTFKTQLFSHFSNYHMHPVVRPKKFLCSFNGTNHVSRQLLCAALIHRGWFDHDTCSKNFTCSLKELDGFVGDLTLDQARLYNKFFTQKDFGKMLSRVISFGHGRYNHSQNIKILESILTGCFFNLVSETLATSYYPFVTEKFLYSVVTRGLYVSYAQPGWHRHLHDFFGFKPYTKIFDYGFDQISNPVKRLITLLEMISKFSLLSEDDWNDLYEMEIDTIEYNYDHYFSGNYIKMLSNQTHV